MSYRMEQNNGIDGLPGLVFMGIGVFFLWFETILKIEPSTFQYIAGAISFLCSAAYYVYKFYSDYKKNNPTTKK